MEPVSGKLCEPEDSAGAPIKSADVEVKPVSGNEDELGPHVLIDLSENNDSTIKVMVMVSMLAPFDDSNTLNHAGDFVLEVTGTTTIREVKTGITNTLDIPYEEMALVYSGRILSDNRTINYYVKQDNQTFHLLVESPNELFKFVFDAFKRLGLSEEKSWFATHNFMHVMHTKYSVELGADDNTPTLTEEQLLYELEQLYDSDSDNSDSFSDDSSTGDEFEYPPTVFFIGELELAMMNDELEAGYPLYDEGFDGNLQHGDDDDVADEDDEDYEDDEEANSLDEESDDQEPSDEESDDEDGSFDSNFFVSQGVTSLFANN